MLRKQETLTNAVLRNYFFLKEMYEDGYFPAKLVGKGQLILVDLCTAIEQQQPQTLAELYQLTHAATTKFNDLQAAFWAADSEIETAARDCIAVDFRFVATAYGFEADMEELIATRDW